MNNHKVFVSAYACEPGLGSEIGVGWHWVLEMSRWAELWVLTRESNRHTIEPWISEHPEYAGIHFLYFDLPKWARFWKKGLRGVRTYYNIWQMCTNRIVRRTMQQEGIDTFHHLTYGNVLWPVSSYGQKQRFIWGPVGGLETIPEEYSQHYGRREKWTERIRRALVAMSRRSRGLKNRCKNADVILCKTDITRMALPEKYRDKTVLMTDVATEAATDSAGALSASADSTLRLITVGRLDAWRGFDLAIEAAARAKRALAHQGKTLQLTIVGKGPDKDRLKGLIKELGLEKEVVMTGKVDMKRYRELMQKADAVVNASLKEGAVTVSFDAMAMGKPLVCLDTTGYTRYFTDDYAVIVPIGTREATINALAAGIVKVADAPTRLAMGTQARLAAKEFQWSRKGEEIKTVLDKVLH